TVRLDFILDRVCRFTGACDTWRFDARSDPYRIANDAEEESMTRLWRVVALAGVSVAMTTMVGAQAPAGPPAQGAPAAAPASVVVANPTYVSIPMEIMVDR